MCAFTTDCLEDLLYFTWCVFVCVQCAAAAAAAAAAAPAEDEALSPGNSKDASCVRLRSSMRAYSVSHPPLFFPPHKRVSLESPGEKK